MKPNRIKLPFKIKRPILALGPQKKNTLCFGEGNFAYISSLHPDLANPEDFLSFQEAAKYFLKKGPKIIAYDLHPEYQSTKYALSLANRYSLFAAWHHHAHIASCMAANGFKNEKVIGVAFDGTGLGSDNNLWGAEFFVCNYKEFERIAHLKEAPLIGGEKAILEPARVAAYWLYLIYKDKFLDLDLDLVRKINKKKWGVLRNMHLYGINSPLSSSMGRLFDAAGALISGKGRVNFEAELAIGLEKIAARHSSPAACYRFRVIAREGQYIIDPTPAFREIIADLKAEEPKEKIAYRFHSTVAEMIRKVCLILKKERKINKIVLSGGVFQNNLLLCMALDLLYKEDFKVFMHRDSSCSDSGISLGQVAIANFGS